MQTAQRDSLRETRNACSPSGEIITTLRYRGIKITEYIDVDCGDWIFFLRARDKVDAAKRLELGSEPSARSSPTEIVTYNICVLVLAKYIKGRTKSSAQNCWVLCERVD